MKNNYKSKLEHFRMKEEIERIHITKLYHSTFFNKYDKKIIIEEIGSKSRIDAQVYLFEKGTDKLSKRLLIEAKVRDKHYADMMLERFKLDGMKRTRTKKDNEMKKMGMDIDSSLLYYCVSPIGSYLFNIDKMIKDIKWSYRMLPKTSYDKTLVEKEVCYLDTTSKHCKFFKDLKTTNLKDNDIRTEDKRMINQKQNKVVFGMNILEDFDLD